MNLVGTVSPVGERKVWEIYSGNSGDVCVGVYENGTYEGWNFNSGNYLFTTDTK